jgi:hypothetical protein
MNKKESQIIPQSDRLEPPLPAKYHLMDDLQF